MQVINRTSPHCLLWSLSEPRKVAMSRWLSLYHSTLLNLLKELHTIRRFKAKRKYAGSYRNLSLAHYPVSLCPSSTCSPDWGMDKKLFGEVQLPDLSEILITHDCLILFLFWFHHFSSINTLLVIMVSFLARESRTFVTFWKHSNCK